jgi:hypothetical protein
MDFLIPIALAIVALPILGVVGHKLWLKYAPSAEATAYSKGIKVVQQLARLNAEPTAAEKAKAAAAQAKVDAMRAEFKAELAKLLV